MANIILKPEIESISGRVGKLIFRTYKNGKVSVFSAPEYKRRTPLSDKEKLKRKIFGLRAKRAKELMASGIPKTEAWQIAKTEIY